MNQICRTCLSSSQKMENLFVKQPHLEIQSYSDVLNTFFTDLKFSENECEMPQNICKKCVAKLTMAFTFYKTCKKANLKLRKPKFVKKVTQKTNSKKSSAKSKKKDPLPQDVSDDDDQQQDESLEIEVTVSDGEIEVGECKPSVLVVPKPKIIKPTRNLNHGLCSICGKKFATNQRLKNHLLTHTGEKNYECGICKKLFATSARRSAHHRVHTGERPYKCEQEGCTLRFAQSNALKCHLRTHTKEKPYECKICGKSFSQNTILKTHMSLHVGKTVKCDQCDKKFSRPSYLILHRREHTGEKPYACHKCPNRYMQKSHLDRHLDTHLGVKHKCIYCQKEYTKSWSLKIHLYSHKADSERPFHCEVCQQSFVRRKNYVTHMKQHEQRERNDNQLNLTTETSQINKLDQTVIDDYSMIMTTHNLIVLNADDVNELSINKTEFL